MPLDIAKFTAAVPSRGRSLSPEQQRPELSQRSQLEREPRQRPAAPSAESRPQHSTTDARSGREREALERSAAGRRVGAGEAQEFRRSLASSSQGDPAPRSALNEGSPEAVPGQLVIAPADRDAEGEIALSLLLPAALGEDAAAQIQWDVTTLGVDEAAALLPQQLVQPRVDHRENGKTAPSTDPLVMLPPSLAAKDEQTDLPRALLPEGQEAVVLVEVEGQTVPVTLQVLPQVQTPTTVEAIPLSTTGQPMEIAALAEMPSQHVSAAQALSALGVVNPVASNQVGMPAAADLTQQQVMQLGGVKSGQGVQLAAAPAPVAELAAAALPPADAESPQALPQLSSSSSPTAQALAESMRPVPTPQGNQAAHAEAAERAVQQQVSRAIVQQMANGDRTLTLRLTPPDLGTVRIELVETRGLITVRFHVEDDSVRQALERQLPQLRQDLRAGDAPIAQVRLEDGSNPWHQGQQQHGSGAGNGPGGSRQGPAFSLDGGFAEEEIAEDHTRPVRGLGGQVSDEAVDARA